MHRRRGRILFLRHRPADNGLAHRLGRGRRICLVFRVGKVCLNSRPFGQYADAARLKRYFLDKTRRDFDLATGGKADAPFDPAVKVQRRHCPGVQIAGLSSCIAPDPDQLGLCGLDQVARIEQWLSGGGRGRQCARVK